jgi:putative ABC transport system permease protein
MRYDDFSAAWRHLRRSPRFSVLATLTLALGLTAAITTFGLLSAVFLAPLPYANAARLWAPHLLAQAPGHPAPERAAFSYLDFESFRKAQQVFARVAAYVGNLLPLKGARGPDRIEAEFVTPEYFAVLGARPEVGRLFVPAAGETAADAHSLLLSDRLWRRRFGADPAIVGRRVEILHEGFTVIGVLPADFPGLIDNTEIWLPLASLPTLWDYPDALTSQEFRQLRVVALARPGVSAAEVRGRIANAGRALAAATRGVEGGAVGAEAETLAESRRDPNLRRILVLLFGAGSAVLLIASANVAGLQLARTTARQQELAIRGALGATRRRVIAQGITESGILAWIGGAAGLVLAAALLRALVVVAPPDLPSWGLSGADLKSLAQAGIRPSVVLFAVAVTLVATVLAGLVPAFAASASDAGAVLREGGASLAGAQGHRRQLGRRLLVITQTAAAVALLAAAGLLLRSLQGLLEIDPGFHAGPVSTLHIESATEYDQDRAPIFHQRMLEEVVKLPGVSAAAFGNCVPFSCRRTTTLGSVDGKALAKELSPTFGTQFVSPGYFRMLGIPLLAGRDFTPGDRMGAPRVVVVSQTLARRMWPHESALGHHLHSNADMRGKEEAEVIGVVADARLRSLTSPPTGDLFVADSQNGAAWGFLFVRTVESQAAFAPVLRQTLQRIDPNLPFVEMGSVGEQLARASSRSRFATVLISVIAAVALFLTLLAVYGVVAQGVEARRRELALRVALGASPGDVLGLVLRQGLFPVLAGLVLGAPLAWAASRWLESLLYGAEGIAPSVSLTVLVLIVVATVLACLVPARRALRVDPAISLRHE